MPRLQLFGLLLVSCSLLVLTPSETMPVKAQAQSTRPTSNRKRVVIKPRRDQPAPTVTIPGGRRDDGKCPEDRDFGAPVTAKERKDLLTPLVMQPMSSLSLTTLEQPTLLVYVPSTSAKGLEVTLEANKRGIARTTIELPKTPGIIRVPLTKFPSLRVDQDYRWIVSIVCDSGDPKDTFSAGIIRRIQLDKALANRIKQASPIDRAVLYAEAGIWYEAVSIVDELHRSQPNNKELQGLWEDCLKSAGLEILATIPVKN